MLNVLVERRPEQVWDVLCDGWAYADWVVGTQHIEDVDDHWPQQGSRIRFAVQVGPWILKNVTTVRLVEPKSRLEMEAHAGKLGSARISITLLPWGGDRTVVILDEHPLTGPGKWGYTVLLDGLLRFRNQRMVGKLAELVQQRHPD